MKRIIRKIFAALLSFVVLVGIFSMSGCVGACQRLWADLSAQSPLPVHENEIYKYVVKTQDSGYKVSYIVGLTELGQGKTELVLPELIDVYPVYGIGYERSIEPFMSNVVYEGDFSSENLVKLYIPLNTPAGWHVYCANCPNAYSVIWRDGDAVKYPWASLDNQIIGYNVLPEYLSWQGEDHFSIKQKILANVSYMYNYENAQDDGYYWVDSYDSNLISFMPPEPSREGYSFGGWYKEPECINVWNFEADKTGEEIPLSSAVFEDYDENQITYLYAKWYKN